RLRELQGRVAVREVRELQRDRARPRAEDALAVHELWPRPAVDVAGRLALRVLHALQGRHARSARPRALQLRTVPPRPRSLPVRAVLARARLAVAVVALSEVPPAQPARPARVVRH